MPAQIHYATGDPAGGRPGSTSWWPVDGGGHLFTDPSLPDEHDPVATEQLWARALAFCAAR